MLSVAQKIKRGIIEWLINNELESVLTIPSQLQVPHVLVGTKKTHKNKHKHYPLD
jgi:hypothetical protein